MCFVIFSEHFGCDFPLEQIFIYVHLVKVKRFKRESHKKLSLDMVFLFVQNYSFSSLFYTQTLCGIHMRQYILTLTDGNRMVSIGNDKGARIVRQISAISNGPSAASIKDNLELRKKLPEKTKKGNILFFNNAIQNAERN